MAKLFMAAGSRIGRAVGAKRVGWTSFVRLDRARVHGQKADVAW
jgi:hypothetical protein